MRYRGPEHYIHCRPVWNHVTIVILCAGTHSHSHRLQVCSRRMRPPHTRATATLARFHRSRLSRVSRCRSRCACRLVYSELPRWTFISDAITTSRVTPRCSAGSTYFAFGVVFLVSFSFCTSYFSICTLFCLKQTVHMQKKIFLFQILL